MKGILFDLDETLIDRNRAVEIFAVNLWQESFTKKQISQSSFLEQVIELDQYGYTPRPEFFDSMLRCFPEALTSGPILERLFYEQVWETPVLADGVLNHLSHLQQEGIPLGLVTNGSSKAQSSKIENSGLVKYFDVVLVSEDFGVKKPDPSIYLEASNRLGVKPVDCWFVGDHPVNDIWGSKQVFFRSAWVHLNRPWPANLSPCYDLKGVNFNETMSLIVDSNLT
jgi:putative hydrolase of the HAD superfamily